MAGVTSDKTIEALRFISASRFTQDGECLETFKLANADGSIVAEITTRGDDQNHKILVDQFVRGNYVFIGFRRSP